MVIYSYERISVHFYSMFRIYYTLLGINMCVSYIFVLNGHDNIRIMSNQVCKVFFFFYLKVYMVSNKK